ncbi:hypothetical protein D3C77_803750 [compost metagenome]
MTNLIVGAPIKDMNTPAMLWPIVLDITVPAAIPIPSTRSALVTYCSLICFSENPILFIMAICV